MSIDTSTAIHPTTDDRARRRWARVGQSNLPDARQAGRQAAQDALDGERAGLVLVFCSDSYQLEELISSIAEEAGDAPLIGCSTAGEIATSGPGQASVVVTALGGEGFSFTTAISTGVSSRLREAGAEAAGCVQRGQQGGHQVLLLLTDGLAGDQQEIVRGAYGVLGAGVPLVGGCAGDDLKMVQTHQFHGSSVHTNALVAAAITSDAPMGIGVRHGWRKVGEPLLVTHSSSNRVFTLDDQPALDVYLDRLQAPQEARQDPAAFTRFAITHPLGLSRRSGEEVRFVGEANFQDRSLGCIASVPQGALTWFMEGDSKSVLDAVDDACQAALGPLQGQTPVGLIAFDCIARRGVLGDPGIIAEVSRIGEHASGAPVAGFYTYGEIARTHGVSGFHNQTLVVLALA